MRFLDTLEIFFAQKRQLQHDSMPVFPLAPRFFCSGMRSNQTSETLDEKVAYLFSLFGFFLMFFSPFLYLLFLSFRGGDLPSTGLAFGLEISKKATSRRAIFTME